MWLEVHNGDLIQSNATVIVHQVNCMGAMGSGVAKGIREKWENVYYKYIEACKEAYPNTRSLLGTICPVPLRFGGNTKYVVNLFGQYEFGYDGKRYTSYDAVYDGLISLKKFVLENFENESTTTVAFPWKMSSVRGGAEWDIIDCMIRTVFDDTNITIQYWKYEK